MNEDWTALDYERRRRRFVEIRLLYRSVYVHASLIFAGSSSPLLPQQLYQMEHEKLGTLQLFVVPIGPDPEGQRMRYEVAFNRLRREHGSERQQCNRRLFRC